MFLRNSVDTLTVSIDLHNGSIDLHDDFVDGGDVVHNFALHLDVEIFFQSVALHGHDVVTGGGQLVEVSIECLHVIVPPGGAHMVEVRLCKSKRVSEKLIHLTAKTKGTATFMLVRNVRYHW